MISSEGASIVALFLGAGFLAAAVRSMVSKVALLTEVRQGEEPRAFRFLVLVYWFLGLAGVGIGVATLFGGLRG